MVKIKKIGNHKVIMSNPCGKADYFAWPSIARLQNGKLAAVASGYRYAHICPFGKAVIAYSEDEGETYTIPAPVIDTPLDDRDAGILAFGENNVIVTSFNNSVAFQRKCAGHYMSAENEREKVMRFFEKSLDLVTACEEEQYLGSEFCISRDCGVTFGEIYKSPVTSPHGPCALYDGTVLWVGKTFCADETKGDDGEIKAYVINPDGTMQERGVLPHVYEENKRLLLCEPYAIELPDGRLICHIRAQRYDESGCTYFTLYQSESCDGGRNWSVPHRILDKTEGAPSHMMLHSSGILLATYGHREKPYGIRVMFSKDGGNNWDTGYEIYSDEVSDDIGYPCSVELQDGSILTVFYAHEKVGGPAVIMQQKWEMYGI